MGHSIYLIKLNIYALFAILLVKFGRSTTNSFEVHMKNVISYQATKDVWLVYELMAHGPEISGAFHIISKSAQKQRNLTNTYTGKFNLKLA